MRTGTHPVTASCGCGKIVPGLCVHDTGSAETTFFVNTTPTVSVSYSPTDALGNGTLMAPFDFPNTAQAHDRHLDLFVDDVFRADFGAETPSGTWMRPLSTACWREGSHQLKVVATACRAAEPDYQDEATTTVTVGTRPEVEVNASGPDVEGQAVLTIPFNFENTNRAHDRHLDLFVDETLWDAFGAEEVAGTWTRPINTACWRQGSHEVKVLATACNVAEPDYQREATTQLQVDHQPEITLTIGPAAPNAPAGTHLAKVSFKYPQTLTSNQRHLQLKAFPSGRILGAFSPTIREGTWEVQVACEDGANGLLVAEGTACSETKDKATAALPGCPQPLRMDGCWEEDECRSGCTGPPSGGPGDSGGNGGGGVSVGGGPPSVGGDGPGARLVYLGGGAGSPGSPGRAEWSATLGRNWSHDYAERIVPDPQVAGRAWLITRSGSFRRYTDANTDGVYETAFPEDEERALSRVGSGWELRDLEGTVQSFDGEGRWTETSDRHGNTKTASYTAGRLASVTMPDGRREDFGYDTAGKLASITEVGVGGAAQRTWEYRWTSDDLVAIERPGGTELRFVYGDSRHPGLMTRRLLVGADDGNPGTPRPERVEGAWDYDGEGNVVRAWRGAEAFALGVDRYEFAYDNPFEPEETVVTIHRSATERETVVYTLSRTAQWVGAKARVTSISGDCSSCGLGPNAQLFYDDPANPLRPTRTVDGRGHETLMSYDANGRLVEKVEAAGTPESRTTSWSYDPGFPALPARIEVPSVAGGATLRTTVFGYDAEGNATSRSVQGVEAGSFFDFGTITTFNAAGQPLTIDPPGYGTEDRTSFTYDPLRGDLLPLTRTDPLVGTTTFAYDDFNRRTETTDPNGLTAVTAYGALGRVLNVTQKGATPAEDLVTDHEYNAFGDLVRTTLPRGNVVAYGYDPAGRLVSLERKPDAATPGERAVYTLDGAGNRVREELQRWDGEEWTTESFTESVYANRCQVSKVVHADGTATESAYDCDGNLEQVWDENHPREGSAGGGRGDGDDCDEPPCGPPGEGPNEPTQVYEYDALDRLMRVRQPWTGAAGGEAVTRYGYDAQDHLVSVTDAEGNATSYTYSDRDLMTRQESPVSGTTTYAYNEHGELVMEIDARGVTATRTIDPLDRVTFVDSPDPALDTAYTYDDPAVPFSKGRLTAISRTGATVAYAYDRFGRMVQDGELAYGYDANSNRTTIGYPGSVTARYGHDFADRKESLEIQVGSAAPLPIVSGSSYKAFGPLSSLALGNSLSESRSFDARYRPAAIEVPGRLDQHYTTDSVGNIRSIDRAVGADRFFATYAYQDPQYFLTEGNGPWGRRSWLYDRIGNRLEEQVVPADADLPEGYRYAYSPNADGGNTPKLSQIEPAPGGEPGSFQTHGYDAAGDQTTVGVTSGEESPGRTSFLDYSAERRLSRLRTSDGTGTTELSYDGRGFLRRSRLTFSNSNDFVQADPVYSSEGLLYARKFHHQNTRKGPGDGGSATHPVTKHTTSLFYFAGWPVAQLRQFEAGGGPDELLFLTTDHLGVPILATDAAGAQVWAGGLDPFGQPFVFPRTGSGDDEDPPGPPDDGDGGGGGGEEEGLEATSLVMETVGLFLRFPGQWDDPSFQSHGLRGGLYYNVARWYQPGTGRYSSSDPIGLAGGDNLYIYGRSNPVAYIDPTGLQLTVAPDDPFVPDPFDHLPPDCSGGPWRFIRYEYRDKGIEELWQLVRTYPIRIARGGPPGRPGTNSFAIGCVCEYTLAGVFKVTEQWSEWKQRITCSPCEVHERTRYNRENVYRRRLPWIGPSSTRRLTVGGGCYNCPEGPKE
ncbi:MAG TPA: RHS repeat-associated core domain-containing protein [Thermoanaerobaculia bacterium]|nr:RHS repeat-associated core domain-containing protein [Thermoanaerobaculia bacterium]